MYIYKYIYIYIYMYIYIYLCIYIKYGYRYCKNYFLQAFNNLFFDQQFLSNVIIHNYFII